MKILQLFSNWKWTGPAEPAVNLCALLTQSHEIQLIIGAPPHKEMTNDVLAHCLNRGLSPLQGYCLRKHFCIRDNIRDCLKLRALMKKENFDLIHCHMPNDHLLAGIARMGLSKKPRIIRTFYDASGPGKGNRTALLVKYFTDGAITISKAGQEQLVDQFNLIKTRSQVILSGIDIQRFDPERTDRKAARKKYNLGAGDFVLGIVARMQRHRKFEILLNAMKKAVELEPRLKLVIVGRGTNQDEVARQPVVEMGLSDHVFFTGYIQGDDFVEALAAMDAALFLVPGSDGSCRAVREKMVMGLPVIATDIPPLNEMITSGKTGFLVAPTVDGLVDAILKLTQGESMRVQTLKQARKAFSLEEQKVRVNDFYQHIVP